jgi:hypothetical protein
VRIALHAQYNTVFMPFAARQHATQTAPGKAICATRTRLPYRRRSVVRALTVCCIETRRLYCDIWTSAYPPSRKLSRSPATNLCLRCLLAITFLVEKAPQAILPSATASQTPLHLQQIDP